MAFRQMYLGCLSQASYLIGSEGEAVVVDPRRDVEEYLAQARRDHLRIIAIIETHLHADFVSGHLELAKKTGAKIYIGHRAQARYDHVAVHDGDLLQVGKMTLRFLETPGHTPESICVVVEDPANPQEPLKILTGDTLFIGDVGRPDLCGAQNHTPAEMAGMLYDSLWNKILKLPDSTLVYPAHGAGSACGKNISSETSSTLGQQRERNAALQARSKEKFIQMTLADLPVAPQYFSHDAEINRRGALALEELPPLAPLVPAALEQARKGGAVLLDIRENRAFGDGHLPHSLNIGLSGTYASWCGALIGPHRKILLIAENDLEIEEGRMRLARVGLDGVAGFLHGGVDAWRREDRLIKKLPHISVEELKRKKAQEPALQILDVRSPGEFRGGHISAAMSIPLQNFSLSESEALEKQLEPLSRSAPLAVICGSGYRSSAAASLLEEKGFSNLFNVLGGMKAWLAAGFEVQA